MADARVVTEVTVEQGPHDQEQRPVPPPGLRGTDLSPLLRDPESGPVQDEVLFTFDDMHAGTGKVREVVPAAGRIRCIREPRFKYARYFHAEGSFPAEFEMYDLAADPPG